MEAIININRFILFLTIILNLGLGIYIYVKNPRSLANRVFSYVLFAIAYWTGTFIAFSFVRDTQWLLFCRRLTPTGSAVIAGYFMYFALIFPKRERDLTLWQKTALLAPGYFFALASAFTPYMVRYFIVQDASFLFLGVPVFGGLYKVYALYLLAFFSVALAVLFYKFNAGRGHEKLQIFYVLIGMAAAIVIGLTLSLLLPLFKITQFFSLGPAFTLIMVGFVVYSIVHHKLLGMEDFFSRGLLLISGLGVSTLTLVLFLSNQLKYILPAFSILIVFFTGLYVFAQNPRSRINQTFFTTTFFVSAWVFSVVMSLNTSDPASIVAWSKLASVFSAIIAAGFLSFCLVFPKEESDKPGALIFLPAAIFALLTYFNQIVKDAVITQAGAFRMVYGTGFPVMVVYFIGYILLAFYVLIKKSHITKGIAKAQIGYLFVAFFVGMLPPILTNLILPLFGHSEFRALVPAFLIAPFLILAYAIIKHRLMSVEVVIQRSTVYGLVTILIMAFYALAVIVSEMFFRSVMGYSSALITAMAALLIAVIYQPLIKTFQSVADRVFFHGRYEYQKTLREVGHKMASVIKFEDLTKLVVSTFIEAMRVSETSLLIYDRDKKKYRSVAIDFAHGDGRYKRIEIDEASPIANWLKASKDALFLDELESEIIKQEAFGEEGKERLKTLKDVKEEMELLGGVLWIPIIVKDELSGIMFLGNKLSGDVFTAEDLNLLLTLADQIAVALENARLYEEVVTMKNYTEDVLDTMVAGVLTVDMSNTIVTFNPMAERIMGLPAREVVGRSYKETFSPKSSIVHVLDLTLRGKIFTNFEASVVSKERGLIPISLSSSLLRDSNKKKIGALLSITDMTEVRALEGKVRQADKVNALGTMAAGMAHEIKNPLSSMKVLSQLMPLKFDDPEFRSKIIEIMPREINRIDRIVESLLGFARAATPKFTQVDINEVIEKDVEYFSEQAKNSGVKIITDYAPLPQIEGDPDQLSQVFSNLMLNAIHAMPEGGELKVQTRESRKIENVLQDIEVEVSDSGHGITPENLEKLFDPFFTTKHSGTGLGLTIAHSIIDGHKGAIDVKTKVGKGTAFVVTLPVRQELV